MTKKTKISVGLSALACIGVGVTAFIADKRRYILDQKKSDRAAAKWDEMSEEEFFDKIDKVCDEELLTFKDKAVIFLQAEWPTLLSGALTCGCIAGAQVLDIQEIAMFAGLAAGAAYKYKDAMNYIREHFPESYEEVKKYVNMEAAKRAAHDKKYKIEETYDGRDRYFFPFLDQIVYMKPEDVIKVQAFICSRLGAKGVCTVNEVADYICQDLGYKDVHLIRDDMYWELVPYGDREVTEDDFPILLPDYEDIRDNDGEMLPCKVMAPSILPTKIKQFTNRYVQ